MTLPTPVPLQCSEDHGRDRRARRQVVYRLFDRKYELDKALAALSTSPGTTK